MSAYLSGARQVPDALLDVGCSDQSSLVPEAPCCSRRPIKPLTASLEGQGKESRKGRKNHGISLGGAFRRRRRAAQGVAGGLGAAAAYGFGRPAQALPFLPFFGKGKAATPAKDRKRVMILMSDTGGGHRASAEALAAGFKELYGDKFEVEYVDIWTNHTPYPFNQLPKSYSSLVKNPNVWRFGYYVQQPRFVHVPTLRFGAIFTSKQISAAFDHYKPDLVVSVHPLMQLVPLRVLRQRAKAQGTDPVPFATVVTDLTTCHNTWFHAGVDKCFVPTQFCRQSALRLGLKDTQVVVHGLPIRPAFSRRQQSRRRLRKQLGMDAQQPGVLIVGGGEGMGAIEATVAAVAELAGDRCQVVVICGRNAKLQARLRAREYAGGMRVVVNGFVTNMAEWMTACDMIVTKAGPGTIAESLICGLPLILNGFIPCQEAGNVPFVVDNKVGCFERDPHRIGELVGSWLGPAHAEFRAMQARALAIGEQWKGALFKIVQDLAEMVDRAEDKQPFIGTTQANIPAVAIS